jgi:hypothetical protein
MNALIPMILVMAFVVIPAAIFLSKPDDGGEHSMGYNRIHGKYRVLYEDGQVSQPMLHQTAKDYASMFNGKVVPRTYGGRH